MCSNTIANIESTSSNSSHTDIESNEPDPQPDSININSNSNTSSNSNSKTSSNSNSNSDTDTSSTSTVCPQQQQDTDPPVADPTEIPAQSIAETQSTKIPTLVNPHPSTVEILKPVNSAQSTKIPTPVKPDYPTHLDQSTESLDQPTIETLTPATSSEDIFYSPIGLFA